MGKIVCKWMFLLSLAILMVASGSAFAAEYAPGEVLVVFKSDFGQVSASSLSGDEGKSSLSRIAGSVGARVSQTYSALSETRGEVFALLKSDSKTTAEMLEELKANADVLAVSPNYLKRATVAPNDPRYSALWGIKKIRSEEAWEVTTGSSDLYIAVIDSGIDAEHEDLAANFDATYSRNFTSATSTPALNNNYGDRNGHGTHVAGTVGAVGNNALGVAGVNWKIKLIALRVLDEDGVGYTSWSVAAMDYLVGLLKENPEMQVPAVNLSLGGYQDETPEQVVKTPEWLAYKALDSLNRTAIVVAAGNEGLEVNAPAPYAHPLGLFRKGQYAYPASFPGLDNLIVVAAVNESETAPSFTNWSETAVHFVAPGVDILSTALPEGDYNGDGRPDGVSYIAIQGTSMAAPHVAGAIGLMASRYTDLSVYQLKHALLEGANGTINPPSGSSYNTTGQRASSRGLLDLKGAFDRADSAISITYIAVAPQSMSLSVGETNRAIATMMPREADQNIRWSSSNASVATVDENGDIKGIAKGEATISVRPLAGKGLESTVNVTVQSSGTSPGLPGEPGEPGGPGQPGEPSDPENGYTTVPRSDQVQQQIDAVNSQLALNGVTVNFASLNNAMKHYAPSESGWTLFTRVDNATLGSLTSPSAYPSGFTTSGKPTASISVDTGAIFGAGGVALVPVTLQYTLSASELGHYFDGSEIALILAAPQNYASLIFDTLSLQKELGTSSRSFANLIPGILSASEAIANGILQLQGGSLLTITLSILVADDAGDAAVDKGQLIVFDGLKDGTARDPLWLMTKGTSPQPEPGESSGGGSSGCNAFATGTALILAATLAFLKKRR